MKNIVILLGLAATFAMFTGCYNKSSNDSGMAPAAQGTEAPAHYDYKGEK